MDTLDRTKPSRQPHQLLDRSGAAEYLGISPQTLAIWASTRRYGLPFVKIGRRVKYRVTDLDSFIESRVVGAAP